MGRLVVDRLARLVLVLFATSLLTFVLLRLAGDPASVLLPVFASPEQRQELRQSLGLDRPLLMQFGHYLVAVANGDLGESWGYRQPASEVVLSFFAETMQLVVGGLALAIVVSVPLALLAATRAGGMVDSALLSAALIGRAVPNFWLGTLLILLFGVSLGWLPTSGSGTWRHALMPVATIAVFFIAEFTMVLRASLVEALRSDHVRAAVARGASRRTILTRHALRNSLNPLVSVVSVNFGTLLGGTVIVENVFGWPGLGRVAVEAVGQTDYPVLQATVLLFAFTIAVVTTAADLLYGLLDPRIRRAA